MQDLKVAGMDDLPAIVSLIKEFHSNSRHANVSVDEDKLQEFFGMMIESGVKESVILLTLHENKPVGILASSVYETFLNRDRWAGEVAFWVSPDYRNYKRVTKLIEAYEYWAKNVAKCSQVTLASLEPRTGVLYARKGYTEVERAYSKEI